MYSSELQSRVHVGGVHDPIWHLMRAQRMTASGSTDPSHDAPEKRPAPNNSLLFVITTSSREDSSLLSCWCALATFVWSSQSIAAAVVHGSSSDRHFWGFVDVKCIYYTD